METSFSPCILWGSRFSLTVPMCYISSMKKLLYIIYIPLLLIEWTVSTLLEMGKVFHKSIETLTLSVQQEINEPITEEVKQPITVKPKGK